MYLISLYTPFTLTIFMLYMYDIEKRQIREALGWLNKELDSQV